MVHAQYKSILNITLYYHYKICGHTNTNWDYYQVTDTLGQGRRNLFIT